SSSRSGGIRLPRATFCRNGRISSGFVGPPNAMRRTAWIIVTGAASPARAEGGERWGRPGCVVTGAASPARAEGGERWVRPGCVRPLLGRHLVDHVDERLHVVDGRVGQDAMAEVEDVAGAAAGAAQDIGDPLADVRGLRHQY